jgi:hypothetical protein
MTAKTTASQTAFTQLCHHLSLDRAGKVQGACDSLVLTVLAIDPAVGTGDENEVAEALSTYFGLELPLGQVRKAIECHLRAGRLLRGPDSLIRLSAEAAATVEARVAAADQLEATVRREWLLEVALQHPELWERLSTARRTGCAASRADGRR